MTLSSIGERVATALETVSGAFGGPQAFDLPLGNFTLGTTGGALAVFANGVSTTPGIQITNSKASTIRWNNDAAPDPIMTTFGIPRDADTSVDMTLHIQCSKVGATLADATTFTVAAFNQVVAALHDADADFGGTTTAITGDAATKTIQSVSLALATANLAAYPASVTVTIKPTAGLLGTDDICIHHVYVTYTRKNPT